LLRKREKERERGGREFERAYPNLLYLGGYNAADRLTKLAAEDIVLGKHLLEIQTANRNAQRGE